MNEYRLVVCEKPSVARSIAAVLGAGRRGDGFLSGGGYLVSWCFGHLAELSDADAYDEKYGKWRMEDLPILPDSWQYTVARDKQKQMNTLRALMHREDVCEVINACDAGREGELIFRTAYRLNNCRKRVKRLWISSMEDAAILQGFDNLRDGAEYDNLYASALCRSKADWLVGINATRLFSVMYHRTLNVGRVVSPTLALLVQRDAEISAFQPETFYTVNLIFDTFSAVGEKYEDRAEAEAQAKKCNNDTATVTNVERKEKAEKAPALYDLTTLQRDANRLLGYTAQQTLDYLQSLYEKKLCTYPRTDSRYLTDDMEGGVNALALCCAGICGTEPPAAVYSGQVCSSKRVSDHHAVVPTMAAGETDLEALPAGEREILRLAARQVLMAVSEPYRYTETVIALRCGGAEFSAKGKYITAPGWRAYLPQEKQEKAAALPDDIEVGRVLIPGEEVVKEGKTTPPKHFTEDTLLSAMETAGKEDMPEDAERQGLGTPATRAAMIENLLSAGFVERKGKSLVPTKDGINLAVILPDMLKSPLLTAEWETRLTEIAKGSDDPQSFMQGIEDMTRELVKQYSHITEDGKKLFAPEKEAVGICPRCKSPVYEGKKNFYCSDRSCRFVMWKNDKFFESRRTVFSKKIAAALLKDGKAKVKGLYSERTGKTYDGTVLLCDTGEKYVNYRIEQRK